MALASLAGAAAVFAACGGGDVVEPPASSLEIIPDSATLTHIGQTMRFTATQTGDAGTGGAAMLLWESRDTAVFTVDASGLVTARGNGTAQLVASVGRLWDLAIVRVAQEAAVLEPFGQGQRVLAGLAVLQPVGVRLTDAGGTPVAGTLVRFEAVVGGGKADPEAVFSDSAGVASAVWTLGRGAYGGQRLAVWVEDGPRAEIEATALEPDEAVDRLVLHSGGWQWGPAGELLPEPVVVKVLEGVGRAVAGAAVRFEPAPGSGQVVPETAVSDSLGLAAVVWTMGGMPGPQRLEVTAARGARLEVTATAQSDEGVCGRTPAVVEELVRQAGVAGCAEVTEEHLAAVSLLALGGRHIDRVASGDFAGLVNLDNLSLNYNRLATLPPDVFADVSRLRLLDLDFNQLTELPPGIFAGLQGLESLGLTGNRLTRWSPDFGELLSLESLSIGFNRLTELPSGVFAGLPQLWRLWLPRNQLTRIAADAFAGLPNLSYLSLFGNQLSSLPANAFADLAALHRLYLSENELTALPPAIFADTPALTFLRLDHNQLTELPAGIFDGLSDLELLWVNWNRIEALPPTVFQELSKLESLSLTANHIAELPRGVFDGLSNLDRLWLTVNDIVELPPGVFDDLSNLTRLSIRGNRLAELPPGFFRTLPRLGQLDLDRNPGAPFPVALELDRSDTPDVLAPGPAEVVVRAPGTFPAALRVPVSVQRGTLSRAALDLPAGDTVSEAAEVRRTTGTTAAVHVQLGVPDPPEEFYGIEFVAGDELVLFAASDNRTPVLRDSIPPYRLQVGGPSVRVVVEGRFSDSNGDMLSYEAAASAGGVAAARMEGGELVLDPVAEGAVVVEVAAVDPDGLRAAQQVPVTVVSAPDPNGFYIELVFDDGFEEEWKEQIRAAADRWMEVVVGDLPDIPIDGHLDYCADNPGPRLVGTIDDVVIRVHLHPRSVRDVVGSAAACGRREGSGLAFYGSIDLSLYYLDREPPTYTWYETALHEIGHVLGIGSPRWHELLREPSSNSNPGAADTHFPGLQTVRAFNAAGGTSYRGGKVPVETVGLRGINVHWRAAVIPHDIMAISSDASLVTPISVAALEDLGHRVDMSKADPYMLPAAAIAAAKEGAAVAARDTLVSDEVIRGPVVVVDEDGNVVRVIRR